MPDSELSKGFGPYSFDRPDLADTDGLFVVDSDPAVWQHSPAAADESPADARAAIERSLRRWDDAGLDYWIIHDADDTVVGMGGARRMRGYWNLYARITPAAQGRGLATAVQHAAVAAALATDPDLPVVGRLRVTNERSRALCERIGLSFQLEGPPEDDGVGWYVYADRPLDDDLRDRFSR